jgi:hypothetical protein
LQARTGANACILAAAESPKRLKAPRESQNRKPKQK